MEKPIVNQRTPGIVKWLQISVLNGLGWELHRIWTMDWWDNRDKELLKLMQLLGEKKEAAYRIYKQHVNDSVKTFEMEAEASEKPSEEPMEEPAKELAETISDVAAAEEKPEVNRDLKRGTDGFTEKKPVDEMNLVQESVPPVKQNFAAQNPVPETAYVKVASGKNEPVESIVKADPAATEYRVEEYSPADVEVTDLSTADYIKKENLTLIVDKMQQIVDAEAPIMYDRLVKKTLRAFHISRSSPQTLEATDRALKKVSVRMNKQAGVKFYWRKRSGSGSIQDLQK